MKVRTGENINNPGAGKSQARKSRFGYIYYGYGPRSIAGLASVVLHIWTIIIAYGSYGLLGAIIAFFFPGIAEIYFAVVLTLKYGMMNYYTLAVLAVFLLWGFCRGGGRSVECCD